MILYKFREVMANRALTTRPDDAPPPSGDHPEDPVRTPPRRRTADEEFEEYLLRKYRGES